MPHFFIDKNCIQNGFIYINDKETLAHLACALRLRPNEIVKFIDKNETVYKTKIETVSKNEIKGEILSSEKSERKLEIALCALICALKPDAMHLAIENATQLGAKEIYVAISDNCAVKKDAVLKKAEKWQKIANESFKQCERADLPRVYEAASMGEIFKNFKKENIFIFAEKYENSTIKSALSTAGSKEKILAVFGPEGGFSENEFDYFKRENFKLITLGKLILKAPNAVTAGLFGVAQCLTL